MNIDELKAAWNAQADEYNQWDSMGLDEKVAFAQDRERARIKFADEMPSKKVDVLVLELAIKKISEAFDEFVAACVDENGKPKSPSYSSLMKARGHLPPYCKHAFLKKT